MSKYRCTICNWIYDETKEGKTFEKVSDDFFCPVCNAKQNAFVLLSKESGKVKIAGRTVSDVFIDQISEWGVKYVFGLPGTSSLGLVDACRKNSKITYRFKERLKWEKKFSAMPETKQKVCRKRSD